MAISPFEKPVTAESGYIKPEAEQITGPLHFQGPEIGGALPEISVDAAREEVAKVFTFPELTAIIPEQTTSTKVEDVNKGHAEKDVADVEKPKFKVRGATLADIDAIVDVDIRSFDSVYSEYEQDEEQLRQELREKFIGRLEKVGSKWMPVLERDGEIVGFMTCSPTNKRPEDFESWEETTDNGTLKSTYDPDGKNIYVVTLSVLPEGSDGKDMLYGDQIGKMLSAGYKQAFFESRLPGLREWVVQNKLGGADEKLTGLSSEDKESYANEYFNAYTDYKGKQVRQDKLISLYERIGCRSLKVVPDAYKDAPSLDFGVVFVYDGKGLFDGSDLPFKIPENRFTRWAFGKLVTRAAHSQKIAQKLFS